MDQDDGLTANCTYGDIAGALTAISYPGHTSENVTYTHDSYGRTTNTTDAESSYSCTFGDRDEMVTGTRTYTGLPARTLTFAYYPNGSRKSMQLPVAPSGYTNSNCFTYEYDAGGRLTELDDNLGHTNTFSYDANDQIVGQVSGNGLTMAITRNELGQGTDLLNTLSTGGPSALFVSEFNDPSYDGAGNLTGITAVNGTSASLGGTSTYSYDTKDQLTSESNTATGAIISNSFAYDGAGNATTFRGTSRSFNSANEFSGTGFAYDDRGNPTTYAGSTCTFDVFNRATSLGTALTAGYRTDGMRAWKQDGSGTRTYYLYDGTSPLVEMDSSGNYKSEFVYGPAGLISHSRASLPTVFFAYDALGSVQSLWTDTGSLVSSRVYDAYGNQAGGIVASATYDDPEIGYNGQAGYITDPETGLVLCGHRYYDPSAGRWLNRDPISYDGGLNVYSYCTNNPVMGVDPSGLQTGEPPLDSIINELIPVVEECPGVEAAEDAVDNALNDLVTKITDGGSSGTITSGPLKNGIDWTVNKQGYLSHMIDKTGTGMTGRQLFDMMMKIVGSNNMKGFDSSFAFTNLARINEMTANGASLQEAVSLTSTGRWGADYGFTSITNVVGIGTPGNYTSVTSLIIRP